MVAAAVVGGTGALIEVNCETDFVSKNDSFIALCQPLLPNSWPSTTLPTSPPWALCPTSQDGFGPTLEDVRKGLIGKIGENMSIRRFQRFAWRWQTGPYLHGTRIGVVVEFDGDEVAAKDVAMHIAAMKPVS